MARGEALVVIECNECEELIECYLTPVDEGGIVPTWIYHVQHIDGQLAVHGWEMDMENDTHLCETCAEQTRKHPRPTN